MEKFEKPELKKVGEVIWEIPTKHKEGMIVPGRIIATDRLLETMDLAVYDQLSNVACLPGIEYRAICMPDGHSGYGFPIGGVAAFDLEDGVISPGGIGFDINCGMRLIVTNLHVNIVREKIKELVDKLFDNVPAGVGRKGIVEVSEAEFDEVLLKGAKWCLEKGYAWKSDLENMEDSGCIEGGDPTKVSKKAKGRGIKQIGTLGSGNHYLEIQQVADVFDEKVCDELGIQKDKVCIMVHCGSRGLGHQVGTDYLKKFLEVMEGYGLKVMDKELACAPFKSQEGQDYYKAMACAANMAFANRQIITHQIRKVFSEVFGKSAEEMDMRLIYDVAHNIAKIEKHVVNGEKKEVLVHRKGSTRAFGKGREELNEMYKKIGQPIILGGSMETGSYLLLGIENGETFASSAHGSGRVMSRTQARKQIKGKELQKEMEKKGIYIRAVSYSGLAEEAGEAYKDINEVVNTLELARISKKLVRLTPIGNVKG